MASISKDIVWKYSINENTDSVICKGNFRELEKNIDNTKDELYKHITNSDGSAHKVVSDSSDGYISPDIINSINYYNNSASTCCKNNNSKCTFIDDIIVGFHSSSTNRINNLKNWYCCDKTNFTDLSDKFPLCVSLTSTSSYNVQDTNTFAGEYDNTVSENTLIDANRCVKVVNSKAPYIVHKKGAISSLRSYKLIVDDLPAHVDSFALRIVCSRLMPHPDGFTINRDYVYTNGVTIDGFSSGTTVTFDMRYSWGYSGNSRYSVIFKSSDIHVTWKQLTGNTSGDGDLLYYYLTVKAPKNQTYIVTSTTDNYLGGVLPKTDTSGSTSGISSYRSTTGKFKFPFNAKVVVKFKTNNTDPKYTYTCTGNITKYMTSDMIIDSQSAVITINRFTIYITQTKGQTIHVYSNGADHTSSYVVDYGTTFTANVSADKGYVCGYINKTSGTVTSDVYISATHGAVADAPSEFSYYAYCSRGKSHDVINGVTTNYGEPYGPKKAVYDVIKVSRDGYYNIKFVLIGCTGHNHSHSNPGNSFFKFIFKEGSKVIYDTGEQNGYFGPINGTCGESSYTKKYSMDFGEHKFYLSKGIHTIDAYVYLRQKNNKHAAIKLFSFTATPTYIG